MGSRLFGVLISAGLLVVALPPHTLGLLGWVALVPLVLALEGASSQRAAAYGAVFGAASMAGLHFWLWRLPSFNLADGLAMATYLALYPAAWCAALVWLQRRRLPWVAFGALAWALLHVLRAHAGFLADPWDPLAYTQIHDAPVLQIASLGGEALLGLLVCMVNLAFAKAWQLRAPCALLWPVAAVVASHAYGLIGLQDTPRGEPLVVAVIQPGANESSITAKLDRLRALTLDAAVDHPDVVVWPESAVSGYFFDAALQSAMSDLALDAKLPILFGSADFGKYAQEATTTAEDLQLRNQAFLVSRDGTLQGSYAKNRLVPFAEWTPLSSQITWPRWLVARQLHGIAGEAPGLFRLEHGERIGVLICWENLFTDLSRRLRNGGASVIVQLTNDSDFDGPAEPAQHNAASILRAVEYGRPFIVASMTGPSLAIDSKGRLQRALDRSSNPTRMTARVNTQRGVTVYSQLGLKWLWFTVIVALIFMTAAAIRAGRAKP